MSLTVKEVAAVLNIGEFRVRRLVKDGALPAVHDEDGRLAIDEKAVTERLQGVRKAGGAHVTGDGRKTYKGRFTPEELAQIKELFPEAGATIRLGYNYNPEANKAYRARRRAGQSKLAEETKIKLGLA